MPGNQPPPPGWNYPQAPPPGPFSQAEVARPGTVLGGAIMSYIGGGLMLLLAVIVLIGSTSDDFLGGFARGFGAAAAQAATVAVVAGVICVIWGSAVIAAAVGAQKGSNAWRIVLTVLGGLSILLQLGNIVLGNFAAVLPLLYIATATVLFWVGGANEWYASRRATAH